MTSLNMILVSSCRWLCLIHWSQVLSQEWRCSADRRSNFISVINEFIAYEAATYIRGFTIHILSGFNRTLTRSKMLFFIMILIFKCDSLVLGSFCKCFCFPHSSCSSSMAWIRWRSVTSWVCSRCWRWWAVRFWAASPMCSDPVGCSSSATCLQRRPIWPCPWQAGCPCYCSPEPSLCLWTFYQVHDWTLQ